LGGKGKESDSTISSGRGGDTAPFERIILSASTWANFVKKKKEYGLVAAYMVYIRNI